MIKLIKLYYENLKPYIKIGFTVVFIFILLLAIFLLRNLDKRGVLEVDFLDIGQGDASLIITKEGQKILIDTGSNYITAQKVEEVLGSFWNELDLLILTHPDLDHVGGTQDIIDNFKPKTLIESTENTYKSYITSTKSMVFKINTSSQIIINKDLNLETLSPVSQMPGSDNHKSIVNRLIYGNFEFIFMADADVEVERSLVSQGVFDKKTIKILKVGHHGSDTSSSEIFLKKLKPEYCVISVGKDNKYKHPTAETLLKLEKYCKNIYRTDKNGTISFKVSEKTMVIKKEK